jgi:hypothetical protein
MPHDTRPSKPSGDELRHAFSEDLLPQGVSQYYDQLLHRIEDITGSVRRSVVWLLLITAAIELLNRTAISRLQVGPFEVSDLSVARIFLPLVGAYLVFDIIVTQIRNFYSRRLLYAINRTYRPTLYQSGFDVLTLPQYSPLMDPLPLRRSNTILYRALTAFALTLMMGSVLTPFLLILYWYVVLFRAFGTDDVLLWISTLAAAGFVIFAALMMLELFGRALIYHMLRVGRALSRRLVRTG